MDTKTTTAAKTLESLNPNFNRACERLIQTINNLALEYGLDCSETETIIAKSLLMGIASHATRGNERNLLTIMVRYLRDGLAIAMQEVAAQRLKH